MFVQRRRRCDVHGNPRRGGGRCSARSGAAVAFPAAEGEVAAVEPTPEGFEGTEAEARGPRDGERDLEQPERERRNEELRPTDGAVETEARAAEDEKPCDRLEDVRAEGDAPKACDWRGDD